MKPLRTFGVSVALVLGPMAMGCEWHIVDTNPQPRTTSGSSFEAPGTCARPGNAACSVPETVACDVTIDRWKELLVVSRSVLLDRRARNDVDGAPWSFRTRLEELAGSSAEAPALATAWLEQWRDVTAVGPHAAPVTPRPAVLAALLDPWRSGAYGTVAMARTPFRLIAIVNRLDLRTETAGCGGEPGELRFVYSAVDEAGKALAMTVIVEVPYPRTTAANVWAARWHALAKLPFGDAYNDGLATITAEVTRSSDPASWLVRTNEIALAAAKEPWELREFGRDVSSGAPRLVQAPLTATPRVELARTPTLDTWVKENEAQVLTGNFVLPGSLQAGAAPIRDRAFRWNVGAVSEQTRKAFSMGTCSGCHGGERSGDVLPFQHLAAPDQTVEYYGSGNDGETRVSRWLHDPSRNEDELTRRSKSVATMLCGACAAPVTPSSSGGSYGDTPTANETRSAAVR